MASTKLSNDFEMYCQDQTRQQRLILTKLDKDTHMRNEKCIPDLGIIMQGLRGGYNNHVLSNNTADIESNLFGIGSTNLAENTSNKVTPRINKLDKCSFFPLNKVFLPNPLVIEKYQRPPGPFS